MLFFYVRHGDPIYDPDSLTPLGSRQAEALAKRLALFGLDKIYSSPSNRAILTARPTCELLKLEPELLDFCNEGYALKDFFVGDATYSDWAFRHLKVRPMLMDPAVVAMGHDWYRHPSLDAYTFGQGVERVYDGLDELMSSLGYAHDRYHGRYRVEQPDDKRVALFAHQGFGLVFLSCLLDIPYPLFATHFDICPSGMTVIDLREEDGWAVPRVLTWSSDSHIYREGLPLRYDSDKRWQF